MSKTIAISSPAIKKLTTPQLLKGGLYLTWATSLVLLITTIAGVQSQRQAIQTVGKDSVPSILTAQRIKDSLADMDANAANELLVRPGQNPDASKSYDERRQKLAMLLVNAAQNITYPGEQQAIETLLVSLGDYMQKIQQARDFNERGNTVEVVTTYRAAAEIVDKTLLPTADRLDVINSSELESTYHRQQATSAVSLLVVTASGLLLIVVLVNLQIFLYRRMRRILNPMLMVATAVALIFLGYAGWAFLSVSYHLKVAKEDAFASLHALRQSRALAYSANGDESRYLLDSAFAATHEQAFFKKVAKIAQLPSGQTFETVVAATAKGEKVAGFSGFLADELNNITFPGEREATVATLSTFGRYLAIDRQIRQLQRSGKHLEAVVLCTGNNPGQSNSVFEEFKKVHDQTMDINLKAFNRSVEEGFKDLSGFEIVTPAAMGAVGLLTLFGLLPRLKEYSV